MSTHPASRAHSSRAPAVHVRAAARVLLGVTIACVLGGCRSSPTVEPIEPASSASDSVAGFAAFSGRLHASLQALGFDTSEGDHAGPSSESYLAVHRTTGQTLSVNTSWRLREPAGSFDPLIAANVRVPDNAIPIARGTSEGAWMDCGPFQYELLSGEGLTSVLAALRTSATRLGCR